MAYEGAGRTGRRAPVLTGAEPPDPGGGRRRGHAATVAVRTVQARTSSSTLPEGFSYSALTELVLFMLLCAVAACAAIVETRRLGLYERISAAPVSRRAMVGGEALNYLAIALSQSLLIVFVGSLAFGVSWGNPLAAGALLLATPQAWAVDAKTNLLSRYLSH